MKTIIVIISLLCVYGYYLWGSREILPEDSSACKDNISLARYVVEDSPWYGRVYTCKGKPRKGDKK